MVCESNAQVLHAYIDGELDPIRSVEFEQHLKTCVGCEQALSAEQTLRKSIRSADLYQRAPEGLADRLRRNAVGPASTGLRSMGPRSRPIRRPSSSRWVGIAAGFVLAVAIGALLNHELRGTDQSDLVAQEVVASHIRSLQPGHLFDVESTDQHTVKPWFDGKLDFAPPIRDLADQGYPLVGGRLDYIGIRTVAALVYQRRKHIINVFVWPEAAGGFSTEPGEKSKTIDGYNLVSWRQNGMYLCAVSDVSSDDLHQFVQLLKQ